MKIKLIPNKIIREYPNLFPAPAGHPATGMPHVYKEGKFYVMFKGDLNTNHDKTNCVVHDALGAVDIMCLQIILSYPDPVSRKQYVTQILKMLTLSPDTERYTLYQLSKLLHNSIDWIEWVFGFKIQFEGNTIALNAYALSKLNYDWNTIPKSLINTLHQHPALFVPRVTAYKQSIRKVKVKKK